MKKGLLLLLFVLAGSIVTFSQSVLQVVCNEDIAYTVYLDNHPYHVKSGDYLTIENIEAGIHDILFVADDKSYPVLRSAIFVPQKCQIVYLVKYKNKNAKIFPVSVVDFDDNTVYGEGNKTETNDDKKDDGTIVINVNVVGNNTNTNTNTSSNTNTNTNAVTNGNSGSGQVAEEVVYVEQTAGVTCWEPMDPQRFSNALASIRKQSFSDDKMAVAKQVVSSNCLTTNQIKRIAKLFSFEDDKLEFAKFAYDYVYDPENYYEIYDVFDFSSSVQKLKEYLSGY